MNYSWKKWVYFIGSDEALSEWLAFQKTRYIHQLKMAADENVFNLTELKEFLSTDLDHSLKGIDVFLIVKTGADKSVTRLSSWCGWRRTQAVGAHRPLIIMKKQTHFRFFGYIHRIVGTHGFSLCYIVFNVECSATARKPVGSDNIFFLEAYFSTVSNVQ